MHPHDRVRCLRSFGRELLGRYLQAPGALYNFDPIVRETFESRGLAQVRSRRENRSDDRKIMTGDAI